MQNRSIWLEIILKKKKWKSFSHVRLFTTPRTSPWNSPGQNTGVGSLSLLQRIFPTQGIEPGSPALQVDSLPTELPKKKNLACNAGDAGSNLGRGTKSSLSVQQLSPLDTTEPMHSDLCTTVKKIPCDARKMSHAANRTRCSQINVFLKAEKRKKEKRERKREKKRKKRKKNASCCWGTQNTQRGQDSRGSWF